nr:MAG TPA: hypothetical protein [Caudoviricetes sp.]
MTRHLTRNLPRLPLVHPLHHSDVLCPFNIPLVQVLIDGHHGRRRCGSFPPRSACKTGLPAPGRRACIPRTVLRRCARLPARPQCATSAA